jgi:hypothetical protein
MTYSILGFDPLNGDLGVAIQSKFSGVGSLVPYAKRGSALSPPRPSRIHGTDRSALPAQKGRNTAKGGRSPAERRRSGALIQRQFALLDGNGHTAV